ncbi:unnamed protein product [Arabis nemorensis]|uniref:Uncharacterized protein n=1 Tax=Arabis nemorensis TaxID=586526 RepID=A0A565BCE8_9BRAS|nr:unnamed protein product [Arabis nemorensis]
MSLDQTTYLDITSSISGQEIVMSQEKTLEMQGSQEQDQDMKELQKTDQDAQEGLQDDFYTKKPVEQRVGHEMDQGAPIRLIQRQGKFYSIYSILAGSKSPPNG